jgi:hypothetical protein
LEKAMQAKYLALDELQTKLEKKVMGVEVHTKDSAGAWPEFLKPFQKQIEAFGIRGLQALAEKLMGGDWLSKTIRGVVVAHPEFQAIWNDTEKRNAATRGLLDALPAGIGENLIRILAAAVDEAAGKGGAQQ